MQRLQILEILNAVIRLPPSRHQNDGISIERTMGPLEISSDGNIERSSLLTECLWVEMLQ